MNPILRYAIDGDIYRLEAALAARQYIHRLQRRRWLIMALVALTLGCTGAVLATGLSSTDQRRSEVVALPTHAGVY